jgi:uncharacterized protein
MFVQLAMVLAVGTSVPQKAPIPVDCSHPQFLTESTICHHPQLIQLDARLGAYYEIATQFVAMGARGDLADSMSAFPTNRNKCGSNITCIANAYKQQMLPLQNIIDRVKTHGPF